MDTHTREIGREEWVAFFDSFSRQHDRWLITLEVLGPEIGAQVESREQALNGITAELSDTGEDVISILVGSRSNDHVAHMVRAPSHVRLKETAEGAHEALQIESMSGVTTLLRFRSAVLPEAVDGIVLDR
jgi:uncharacterized protein DUF5335